MLLKILVIIKYTQSMMTRARCRFAIEQETLKMTRYEARIAKKGVNKKGENYMKGSWAFERGEIR